MRKETLEEVAEKEYPFAFGGVGNVENDKKNHFIKGAKWQAERMYSEEEVNEIIAEAWNSCEDNEGETFTEVRKRIIKQFKKK